MDQQRFDTVARTVAQAPTRRALLGLLIAGAAGAIVPRRAAAQVGWWPCPPGYDRCGGDCVNLDSNLDHCGGCFEPCESGLVAVDCRDGRCVRNDCGPDLTYCGVIGGCRDLTSDPESCGGCGLVCDGGVCVDGVCGLSPDGCPSGLIRCGDAGCVDVTSNLDHCGACFEACSSGLVAVSCQDGTCVRDQCGDPALTYCGLADGCRNLSFDPESCGGCGLICPDGTDCWYGTCL